MSQVSLRDYQIEAIELTEERFARSQTSFREILVMPTGSGKTTVFSAFTERAHRQGKRVLIVVHRVELVDQISKRLLKFGVDHGVIAAGYQERRYCEVQVASIQSLSRRNSPPADIVIIDECHHAPANTYRALWRMYPRAKFLGVTATPVRLNGEGFEDLFDEMVVIKDLHWFFERGYLVRPVHHLVGFVDTANIPMRHGDFDPGVVQDILSARKYEMDLLYAYENYGRGRKGIAFLPNVRESMAVAARFSDAGIRCAHVDGETPKDERKRILNDFANNRYDLLMNANLFGEGLDVPDIEVVLLGRLTASLSLFKQQVGRAFRPSEGKSNGIVLDCLGLWHVHGCFAYDDHAWSLEGTAVVKRESGTAREKIVLDMPPPDVSELAEDVNTADGGELLVPPQEETLTVNHHSVLLGFDVSGAIVNVTDSPELLGIRMLPVTANDSLRRISIFESILEDCVKKKYKGTAAPIRYRNYLDKNRLRLTIEEVTYIEKRCRELGLGVKEGYWYYYRQEVVA